MERKRKGKEVERKRKGGTRIGHPEQKPSNRSTEAQRGLATQNASLIQNFKPTMKINPIKIAFIKKELETKLIREPQSKLNKSKKIYPLITTYKDTIYGYESIEPGKYQDIPKIIMAHKTFPILFMDNEGTYGLYGRDKYIFIGKNLSEQYDYLSLPDVQKIIKSFTVRMNFIEKDIFKYISL